MNDEVKIKKHIQRMIQEEFGEQVAFIRSNINRYHNNYSKHNIIVSEYRVILYCNYMQSMPIEKIFTDKHILYVDQIKKDDLMMLKLGGYDNYLHLEDCILNYSKYYTKHGIPFKIKSIEFKTV